MEELLCLHGETKVLSLIVPRIILYVWYLLLTRSGSMSHNRDLVNSDPRQTRLCRFNLVVLQTTQTGTALEKDLGETGILLS